MSTTKFSDVMVCYDYYSRNGFGGMNASHATFSPHSKKDMANGKYILDTYDTDEYFTGFVDRCGPKAIKHGFVARDVTVEIQKGLRDAGGK